jgi:hypothetical protein
MGQDIYTTLDYRFVIEDIGIVFTRILHEVFGPLHVLHIAIQHSHEDILHFLDRIRYLLNEIQEALLLGKSNTILVRLTSDFFRPIMPWRMTSPTGKCSCPLPLSLP